VDEAEHTRSTAVSRFIVLCDDDDDDDDVVNGALDAPACKPSSCGCLCRFVHSTPINLFITLFALLLLAADLERAVGLWIFSAIVSLGENFLRSAPSCPSFFPSFL